MVIGAGLLVSKGKLFLDHRKHVINRTIWKKMSESRVKPIESWNFISRIRELRGSVAICNISQMYAPMLAEKMEHSTRAVRGKPKRDDEVVWSEEMDRAFSRSK
jgi:hypothetical protein